MSVWVCGCVFSKFSEKRSNNLLPSNDKIRTKAHFKASGAFKSVQPSSEARLVNSKYGCCSPSSFTCRVSGPRAIVRQHLTIQQKMAALPFFFVLRRLQYRLRCNCFHVPGSARSLRLFRFFFSPAACAPFVPAVPLGSPSFATTLLARG